MPEVCSICMEKPVNPVMTVCGHRFCTACIREWLGKANTCPMCRAKVIGKKQDLYHRFFVLILFFWSLWLMIRAAQLFGSLKEPESPAHQRSATLISYVIALLMLYMFHLYIDKVDSLVAAKQRGVTSDALENVLLVFILTGISICLVPSFAHFFGATAVMFLVLIIPRAWDLCMGFSCLILYMSYSMPALLKFTDKIVLSVLTGFPIIGAWLHSTLVAHAIVIIMTAFLFMAMLKGYMVLTVWNNDTFEVDMFLIYDKKMVQLLVLTCHWEIYSWRNVLETCAPSAEARANIRQLIQRAEDDLARSQAILSRLT